MTKHRINIFQFIRHLRSDRLLRLLIGIFIVDHGDDRIVSKSAGRGGGGGGGGGCGDDDLDVTDGLYDS